MEGCTFAEIVERMFSKIEQMKSQVNTLDEMLLNQGEALAQAKTQAVPSGFVLVPKEPTKDTLIEIASVCIGDDFANLDESRELYQAMLAASQEPK